MGMKKNGKSLLAKTVALSMAVGTMTPMAALAASNDIGGHWAESTIASWQNRGLIGGYEDGSFKPDKAITRAEFVRLINQALGFNEAGNVNFSDVSSSDWYYNDVAIAMGKQYCSGFPDGTFQPNAVVTRGQAASFIANAKNLTSNAQAADSIADSASMPDWAKGSIGAVIGAGYMSGYPDGTFQSDKVFTRAEAVSTLDRVINGASSTPGQNEPDREDSSSEVTDTSQAKAPDGYSGHSTGRKGSSGGGGGGSSSSDSKNDATISSANATDFSGKTISGTATILVGSAPVELKDVNFKGDVEVKPESGVVNAADTVKPTYKIIMSGNTKVAGNVTVNTSVTIEAESVSNTIATLITKAKTALAGKLSVSRVQAAAPTIIADTAAVNAVTTTEDAPIAVTDTATVISVEANAAVTTEAGTTVNSITAVAGSQASVDVQGTVDTITTSGNGTVAEIKIGGESKPEVTINKGTDVTNVAVTGDAQPKVNLADGSKVTNLDITGNSSATVNTEQGSEIKDISVDSTQKTEIKGSGEITGGITATDESKINVSDTVSGKTEVAERTVSSIVVKTPPAKMTYTVGETLDLSSLVITVTYSDNYTIDIPFAEFGDKVTTAPKHGDKLTAANNGKPVTISMFGKSGATGNLTVTGGDSSTSGISVSSVVVTSATSVEVTMDETEGVEFAFATSVEGADAVTIDGTPTYANGKYTIALSGTGLSANVDYTLTVSKTGLKPYTTTVKFTDTVAVTKVTVTAEADAIDTAGGTLQMTATVEPFNATDKAVTWSVDHNEYAIISDTGLLTAIGDGTVVVTATAGGQNGTKSIEITNNGTALDLSKVTYDVAAKTLTGVTDKMEYQLPGQTTWTEGSVGGVAINDVEYVAGTLSIREKAKPINVREIEISAPAAPTVKLEKGAENKTKVTGSTTEMEYLTSVEGATWTPFTDANQEIDVVTDSITSIKVRVAATSTALAGEEVTLPVTDEVIGKAKAAAPSDIELAQGSEQKITIKTAPDSFAPATTEYTGTLSGFISGKADKVKLTVTDSGAAKSTITVKEGEGDAAADEYTSGADYTIKAAGTVLFTVTVSEDGKDPLTYTYTLTVEAAEASAALDAVTTVEGSIPSKQTKVDFTLNTAPAANSTFKVYDAKTDGSEVSGVTATVSGTTLSLNHAEDVPAGDYWVAVTEPGKAESERTKFTILASEAFADNDVSFASWNDSENQIETGNITVAQEDESKLEVVKGVKASITGGAMSFEGTFTPDTIKGHDNITTFFKAPANTVKADFIGSDGTSLQKYSVDSTTGNGFAVMNSDGNTIEYCAAGITIYDGSKAEKYTGPAFKFYDEKGNVIAVYKFTSEGLAPTNG